MEHGDVAARALDIEIAVGREVDLVDEGDLALLEHERIFHRLVIALRHGEHDGARVLAERELRGTDEVADVLDNEQVER